MHGLDSVDFFVARQPLKVIEADLVWSASTISISDIPSSHGSISYRFQRKTAITAESAFSIPMYLTSPLRAFHLEFCKAETGSNIDWWPYQMLENFWRISLDAIPQCDGRIKIIIVIIYSFGLINFDKTQSNTINQVCGVNSRNNRHDNACKETVASTCLR